MRDYEVINYAIKKAIHFALSKITLTAFPADPSMIAMMKLIAF